MFTSTTSRTLNVMAKFCPEPTKGDSCSAIPFICASLAECVLLVILRVILVSVESGIEYERMPSYASPDFVVMVTEVPWQKKSVKGHSQNYRQLTIAAARTNRRRSLACLSGVALSFCGGILTAGVTFAGRTLPFGCGCIELFCVIGLVPVVQAFWELGRLVDRVVSWCASQWSDRARSLVETLCTARYPCEPSPGLAVCFLPVSEVLALEADFIADLATPLL